MIEDMSQARMDKARGTWKVCHPEMYIEQIGVIK
jgi:hypothetical protein